MKLDRAVIMGRGDLYTLDSAELGPSVWMSSPSCDTDLTIIPIVFRKWERVDQTTKGKHVFRAFLGCGVRRASVDSPSYCVCLDLPLVLLAVPSPMDPVHAFELDHPQITSFQMPGPEDIFPCSLAFPPSRD